MSIMKHTKRRRIVTSTLLLFLTFYSSSAQNEIYTYEDCISYALEHSTKIHLSMAQDHINTANYRDAIGRLLPNISASTSANISYGRGIDPTTNTYTNTSSFRNGYGIEAQLLIFDGLYSVFNIKRERLEQIAGRESMKQTEQDVRMSTIEAYYNLLYTKELKRLAIEHLTNSEHQRKQVEKMYDLGMKARQDVSEMKALAAADRLKLAQQSNQYEMAMLQLKAIMNYPIDQELIINDSLRYTDVTPTLLQADEVYAIALHKLPKALIAEEKLMSSKAAYKSIIGTFFPRINLFAGVNTSYSFYMDGTPHEAFRDQIKNRYGAYVGATLSFDIFTGLKKSNSLRRAKAEYYAEENRRDETRNEIYKDIQEAILNLNASVEEFNAATEQAHHLKEVFDAALKNYSVGNISSVELSITATRAKDAEIEVARKLTIYHIQKEWLAYYVQ